MLLRLLLAPLLAVTITATWANQDVFDADAFGRQAARTLESSDVRGTLATEFTNALITVTPSEVASFQSVIRPLVADLMATEEFKRIFADAMSTMYSDVFTKQGNDLVVNLSNTLGILAGSLTLQNPDLAAKLPQNIDQILIDVGNEVQRLELWRFAQSTRHYTFALWFGSIAVAGLAIAVAVDRRRAVLGTGFALIAAAIMVIIVCIAIPIFVYSWMKDPVLGQALSDASQIFVGSLWSMASWSMGIGAILCAFAIASRPSIETPTITGTFARIRTHWEAHRPTSDPGRALVAIGLMALGLFVVVEHAYVIPAATIAVGAFLLFAGSMRFLEIVGRSEGRTARREIGHEIRHPRATSPIVKVVVASTLLLIVVSWVGLLWTSRARSEVTSNQRRTCNGDTALCDRTLDKVAFAGSHNSMSAADDPGWLFAENTHGIPAQLTYGIRALLMKTHYGIPSAVTIGGAPLVVTDRAAELAVNPTAVEQSVPIDPALAQQRMVTSANLDPKLRDVYLCHVYCEYGSLKFTTALAYIRQFLSYSPDNVIILFIGDYVSIDDTLKSFTTAGLADRLWQYDPTKPFPTLGQMIDTKKNLVLLSENSGQPPAWNIPGYGIFQDTPYTFATPDLLLTPGAAGYTGTATVDGPVATTETALDGQQIWTTDWQGLPSCAPNRGTPSSPLFQINHWVTPSGAAPTVAQAATVNAYDVLMPRVQNCSIQRSMFPTIVAVDFYDTGDLLKVVADLNSGAWDGPGGSGGTTTTTG